jgi:hypothetical protein
MDGTEEWLQIMSPFADVQSADLKRALTEVGNDS